MRQLTFSRSIYTLVAEIIMPRYFTLVVLKLYFLISSYRPAASSA